MSSEMFEQSGVWLLLLTTPTSQMEYKLYIHLSICHLSTQRQVIGFVHTVTCQGAGVSGCSFMLETKLEYYTLIRKRYHSLSLQSHTTFVYLQRESVSLV